MRPAFVFSALYYYRKQLPVSSSPTRGRVATAACDGGRSRNNHARVHCAANDPHNFQSTQFRDGNFRFLGAIEFNTQSVFS
jgi:hypothetical protein